MSDPRFTRNGARSNWHKPAPKLDSPTFHGWTRVGTDDTTGFDVFQLGNAFTRATTYDERLSTGYDCLVSIGDDNYGFSGSWQRITEEVRQMQGLPEPEPKPYFLPGYVIPVEAFGGER